jgi:hypothetical protein
VLGAAGAGRGLITPNGTARRSAVWLPAFVASTVRLPAFVACPTLAPGVAD